MKFYHLIFCLLIFPIIGNTSKSKPVASTGHYEFYNNFWINQHHFLYKVAGWIKKEEMEVPSDYALFANAKDKEKAAINKSIQYYIDHVIEKNLLFNKEMYELKRMLIGYDKKEQLPADKLNPALLDILHIFQPIYKKHFWKKHSKRNLQVLNDNLDRIKRFEQPVFDRLAGLAQSEWPEHKIRIDLTFYANWAGAYTSNKPTHAVISTHEDRLEGDWVETVFHESAHSLISSRRGTVAELIKQSAEALDKDSPRGLWHSIQFYLVGRVVQDLLQSEGITYEQYMVREKVFIKHYPALVQILEPYVMGEGTLEEAVKQLVKEL